MFFLLDLRDSTCDGDLSFCGLKKQKYPDKRAMGYPFDKNTEKINDKDVKTLNDFAVALPNVILGECIIKFSENGKK